MENNMTIETLKKLIEIEFERTGTISQFKHEVFRLIDLYESDKQPTSILGYPGSTLTIPCSISDLEVIYSDVCSCNPKNGGSGICGCTMSHKMVDRNTTITTTSTTTSNTDLNK